MKSQALSSATSSWRMTFADEVEAALRQLLTPREEHVLRQRFGIPDTQQQVGDVPARRSLTPKAARRIELRALRKLWLAAVMEARGECTKAG